MPRVPIDEGHRTGEGSGLRPKLKLDKNEYARFVMLEQPWTEWVHNIKAPVFENGVPVKTVKKGKRGDYEVPETEFVGSPLCIGNKDVLDDKGVDETNCPVCAGSKEDPNLKPARRYAANIMRYRLQGGTWNPARPLSFEVTVWAFTARMYDNLLDLQNEIGDLRQHDIRLECEDKQFQRMKIMFSIEPGWFSFDGGADVVRATWNEPGNRATDEQLRDLCGSTRTRQQMQEDVDYCLRQWRKASNVGSAAAADPGTGQFGGQRTADTAIDGLLGDAAPQGGGLDQFAPTTNGGGQAVPAGTDPLGGIRPEPTPAAASTGAPEAAPSGTPAGTQSAPPSDDPLAGVTAGQAAPETAPGGAKNSFDSILEGL